MRLFQRSTSGSGHRQHSLNLEYLESRLLLVVITQASNPWNHLTDSDEFTGVGRMVLFPEDTLTECTGTLLPTGRHVLTAGHCVGPSMPINATWYMGFVTNPLDPDLEFFSFTKTN